MESNDSPKIPDRGETSDIPGLPSWVTGRRSAKTCHYLNTPLFHFFLHHVQVASLLLSERFCRHMGQSGQRVPCSPHSTFELAYLTITLPRYTSASSVCIAHLLTGKINLLIHNFWNNCQFSGSKYLADILKIDVPSRQLRSSSDTGPFEIPSVDTKSPGQPTFAHQGPTVWNHLQHNIRLAPSLHSFKTA